MPRTREFLFETKQPIYRSFFDGKAVTTTLSKRSKGGTLVYECGFRVNGDSDRETMKLIFTESFRERALEITQGDPLNVVGDVYVDSVFRRGRWRQVQELVVGRL